jgi:ornithine carbamoyltransferase
MVRHFLNLTDYSPDEIRRLLQLAQRLKKEWSSGGNKPILKGKVLGMVFQKPSLRTRVSFDMGMRHLGGDALYISPNEVGLGQRESAADVSRVLSRYVDGIMARVFSHQTILGLIQGSRVPVINGLSDYSHPCQGLADLFTVYEKKGRLAGLKLAFVGDGNNVAHSLLYGCSKTGMNIVIGCPRGYEPKAEVVSRSTEEGRKTGSTVRITHDPQEAVQGADVIYTDVWTSMGQEKEKEERIRSFKPYQVNPELVKMAKEDYIFMHCLPAHRGEEVTNEVADSRNSVIFDQAENRMHTQKALMALTM